MAPYHWPNTRGIFAGASNATLALLELAPADGLRERYKGFAYMDVQMLAVCDGLERTPVRWAVDRLTI